MQPCLVFRYTCPQCLANFYVDTFPTTHPPSSRNDAGLLASYGVCQMCKEFNSSSARGNDGSAILPAEELRVSAILPNAPLSRGPAMDSSTISSFDPPVAPESFETTSQATSKGANMISRLAGSNSRSIQPEINRNGPLYIDEKADPESQRLGALPDFLPNFDTQNHQNVASNPSSLQGIFYSPARGSVVSMSAYAYSAPNENRVSSQSTSSYASSVFDDSSSGNRSSVSTLGSQRSLYGRNSLNFRGTRSSLTIPSRSSQRTTPSLPSSNAIRGTVQYECTSMDCAQTFTTKRAWTRHEEEFHSPQYVYTCRLNNSADLSVKLCPDRSHMSLLTPHHLENLHNSAFCCNETPSNHSRFHTYRDDKMLPHLRLWHGLNLDRVPASWKMPFEGAAKHFGCGFCSRRLASWKERSDHIGDHFMKGLTMEQWSEEKAQQGLRVAHPARDDEMMETALGAPLKRMSIENRKDTVPPSDGASNTASSDPRLAGNWNDGDDMWG